MVLFIQNFMSEKSDFKVLRYGPNKSDTCYWSNEIETVTTVLVDICLSFWLFIFCCDIKSKKEILSIFIHIKERKVQDFVFGVISTYERDWERSHLESIH